MGAGSQEFELGPVTVNNGVISSVKIARTGKWNLTSGIMAMMHFRIVVPSSKVQKWSFV